MNQENQTPPTSEGTASNSLAMALLPSLPILMHSSGDAIPENVSHESTALLSTFIEQYVSSLVTAAMDAHDVFTDGEVVGGGGALGVPNFCVKRQLNNQENNAAKKRRIDYWDEPLTNSDDDLSSEDDDAPLLSSRRRNSMSSTSSFNEPTICTAAMLDIHSSRTRKHYVTAPTAMDVRSFIFPICHDAVLYQRVKEMQSQRRQIQRDITDGTVMKSIREEGEELNTGGMVDAWDAVWGTKTVQPRIVGEGAATGAVVKAGLVDGEDVSASWPGLDVLERDRIW